MEIENSKDMVSLNNVPKDGFKRNLGGSKGGGAFSDELHAKFIFGILKSLVKLGR